jgi:hypothetical protein
LLYKPKGRKCPPHSARPWGHVMGSSRYSGRGGCDDTRRRHRRECRQGSSRRTAARCKWRAAKRGTGSQRWPAETRGQTEQIADLRPVDLAQHIGQRFIAARELVQTTAGGGQLHAAGTEGLSGAAHNRLGTQRTNRAHRDQQIAHRAPAIRAGRSGCCGEGCASPRQLWPENNQSRAPVKYTMVRRR